MEENPLVNVISEKEIEAKKMGLRFNKQKVTNLNLSDSSQRKKLWDKWVEEHPGSNKTWRIAKANDSQTLRCQVPVVIKKVLTTVTEAIQANDPDHEEDPIIFPNLERSDSTISDIETQISPSDARDIQNIYPNSGDVIELRRIDPSINRPRAPIETNREIVITKLYINEKLQSEWSTKNLTVASIPIEPFQVKAPSEIYKYKLANCYEFVPESMFKKHKKKRTF